MSESVLPVAERRRDLNLARGQNSRVVQEVLGYSTIGPTMGIYARVTPTIHAAAAKKMQALFADV